VEIAIARAYDRPGPELGTRVLIDRLWPRGLRKEEAPWEHWLPEVAPSNDLRTWFNHDPAKFGLFEKQYLTELAMPKGGAAVQRLRDLAAGRPLVLVTATADKEHNHAVVLRRLLLGEATAPR
jgi:uncharacterized protein YeaO (DUF488 family)